MYDRQKLVQAMCVYTYMYDRQKLVQAVSVCVCTYMYDKSLCRPCVCTYVYDTSEVLGFRPWLRRVGTRRSTYSLPGTSASLDPRDRQMR